MINVSTARPNISNVSLSNDKKIVIIAGPCQIESLEHSLKIAESILTITQKLGLGFVFKSSFDKANRTSVKGQRGIGLDSAIRVFEEVRRQFKLPVITDVHKEEHCEQLKNTVDILQIPAFLCRQTDLLEAAAKTGLIVNVKKGQFLAPEDAANIVTKLEHFGSSKILLTERGTTFGYNNLVVDMRSLEIMKQTKYPVIFDATHSTQKPGGLGQASGGDRKMAPILARCAVSVGISGVFMEVHDNPDVAPSDGPCMIKLNTLEQTLKTLVNIDNIVKNS